MGIDLRVLDRLRVFYHPLHLDADESAAATSVIFKSDGRKVSIPWFIVWFIVAMVLNTYVLDGYPVIGQTLSGIARKGLILTMFFIGASLSREVLKQVGVKPLLQGIALWVVISVGTLAYILW